MQTFFLAPQEKGYFVLNDIFHFIEEDPIHQHHAAAYLAQSNLDPELNASTAIREPGIVIRLVFQGEIPNPLGARGGTTWCIMGSIDHSCRDAYSIIKKIRDKCTRRNQ